MVFSSLTFIFVFLPFFLACYYGVPRRFKNPVALMGSYFFYAWGEPRFVLILLASSLIDYFLGRRLTESGSNHRRRRGILALSLILNVGCLAFFKYANFAVEQINGLLSLDGGAAWEWQAVALPIGISFFTFQKISYMVDLYRGTVGPARSFVDYALYVALFPQLIAGPIIRYHDVAQQIESRDHTLGTFSEGIWRFSLGLGKKVLIANPMGQLADLAFGGQGALPLPLAWLGIAAYSFQIYFDFAGYSDMAIGLGRMMGFRFLENFNRPYISRSITEFWRRWHISLSNWMREYLYIPLGGNRIGPGRTYFNLWIVFLISGLWHGAAWNFVFWGAYHGFFLSLERTPLMAWRKRLPALPATLLTFLIVAVGWVFFRAESFSQALAYLGAMLPGASLEMGQLPLAWQELLTPRTVLVLGIAGLVSFFPESYWHRLKRSGSWQARGFQLGLRFTTVGLLLILSVASLATLSFNPFIYFRF
ncbi:MAG: MBOAT family protein [Desulfobacterales bacterium]